MCAIRRESAGYCYAEAPPCSLRPHFPPCCLPSPRGVSSSPVGYGVLLGGFDSGVVLGALVLQRAAARSSADAVASGGIAIFGLATIGAGTTRYDCLDLR